MAWRLYPGETDIDFFTCSISEEPGRPYGSDGNHAQGVPDLEQEELAILRPSPNLGRRERWTALHCVVMEVGLKRNMDDPGPQVEVRT